MTKIDDEFSGYLIIEEKTFAYYVLRNKVTLLPALSYTDKRREAIQRLCSHNDVVPEFLYGNDGNSEIAILRKDRYLISSGIESSAKLFTPLIIRANGNAASYISALNKTWREYQSITFCGGNINALYDPAVALELFNVREPLTRSGARNIKVRSWDNYTCLSEFQIDGEKVTLTLSVGQRRQKNDQATSKYSLGELYSFLRFSFEKNQTFDEIEKHTAIAKKLVSLLTGQTNVAFDRICLWQRNENGLYCETAVCKMFDCFENYSKRNSNRVIPLEMVFDNISKIVGSIVHGDANPLLELLPEDNRYVNRISIKNVQDMCTALEAFYKIDRNVYREKDGLIENLKNRIKKTISEFRIEHPEIDVNQETTISSSFQYLDVTLKRKAYLLYLENMAAADLVSKKYSISRVSLESIGEFVNLRNAKTHSGTVEWGKSAEIYQPLLAVLYSCLLKYVGCTEKTIMSVVNRLI